MDNAQKKQHVASTISFWNRSRTFVMFIIPGLCLYVVFSITPIVMGAYYSLTDWDGYSRIFHFVGLRNFGEILHDDRFFSALMFNIRYSIMLMVCVLVLGLVLALLLNTKMRGISLFRALYFFPAVLSMLTVGLIFSQIFYRAFPPIADILHMPILKGVLSNPKSAIFGVLFVHVWQGVALPTILFLAGLQTVPVSLQEAAILDGASAWQRFWKITIPFLIPVMTVVLVLTLKSGIMVFDYIMSMTGGGPGGATESIALLIYRHAFTENKFSYSIAEAILAGLIICGISAVEISASGKKKVEL